MNMYDNPLGMFSIYVLSQNFCKQLDTYIDCAIFIPLHVNLQTPIQLTYRQQCALSLKQGVDLHSAQTKIE